MTDEVFSSDFSSFPFDAPDNAHDTLSEETAFRNQRDAVLFVIDSRSSMFEGSEPSFKTAVTAAMKFYQDKMVTNNKDLVGLVLFGTSQASNMFGFPNIFVFHELDLVSAPRLQELEVLAKAVNRTSNSGMYEEFCKVIGHSDVKCSEAHGKGEAKHVKHIAFSDVLWSLLHVFNQQSSKKLAYKRVFFWTDDEDPCANQSFERDKCVARARDLKEHGFSFVVYAARPPKQKVTQGTPPTDASSPSAGICVSIGDNLSSPRASVAAGSRFDEQKFWKLLLYAKDTPSLGTPLDAMDSLGKVVDASTFVLDEVRLPTYPLRSIASLQLGIGVGVDVPSVAVRVYLPVAKAPKRSITWLEASSNDIITTETHMIDKDTGATLTAADIHHTLPVGKVDAAKFLPEEIEKMKSDVSTPGVRILGFRPQSWLKREWNTGRSPFLFVDEEAAGEVGCRFFAQLCRTLLSRHQIAVAEVSMRAKAPPRLAALIPSDNSTVNEAISQGSGFHVWLLPYAEDCRDLDELPKFPKASDESVVAAKQVIKTLRKDTLHIIPNPALQRQLFELQQHALQDTSEKPPADLTLPDVAGMQKFATKFSEFSARAWPDGSYSAEAFAPQPKAAKPPPSKDAVDALNIDKLADEGKLGHVTIPYLKEWLSANGQSTAGLKKDLIDRVSACVASRKKREREE